MIRRLRVKFICINMAIVTVMMLAILGMLLHFTRGDLEQQSIRVMQSVMEDRAYPSRPGEFPRQAKLPYFYVSVNTMGELSAVLWEEGPDTLSRQSNLRNLISDLRKTLCDVGAEGILLKTRNAIAIDADAVDCDYYDFLRHIPYAVNRYQGEYMSQYSWAELTAASIVSG